VHGGGYVSCSSATHRTITAALARLTGCRVFSADYRLAPEARFPAAFEDVVALYTWLLTDGAPGEPIAVAGESAGGGLVLSLAVHARETGRPLPACVVAFSPWTDLAGTGTSLRANQGRCAMFHPENIPAFASVYLDGTPADDPRASPLYADLRGLPPVLLQVGSTELLLDDARRVHERMVACGGASRLTVYDDVPHAWQLLVPFVPEARRAVGEAADFLRSHIERADPTSPAADAYIRLEASSSDRLED
jgi:acetyl esterase/lipase